MEYTLSASNRIQRYLLAVILVVAACIRLLAWYDMPYQHDELSALHRLQFSSLQELFSKGIMVDGHPMLVQLFLYGWTSIFGTAEWIVKLPFVLCGIAAVYFAYRVAKEWSSSSTALIVAAFMAVLQLSVFHSLHARPYAPGMLFLLWISLEWWRLVREDERASAWKYVLAVLLGSFTHHFVALGALLLGVVGLFQIPSNRRKQYLIPQVIIVLVYLIYLPVTLSQLKYGGLGGPNGWLQTPEISFLWKYVVHVFMYSLWLLIATLVALMLLYGQVWRKVFDLTSLRWVTLLMFILPLLIGYAYSVWISPIIQYSLLVFFVPFLFLFLFGKVPDEIPALRLSLSVFLILGVGSATLFLQRDILGMSHSSVFRDAPQISSDLMQNQEWKMEDGAFLYNENADYLRFYSGNTIPFVSFLGQEQNQSKICHWFERSEKTFMVMANPGTHILAQGFERFPFRYALKRSFNEEIYLLSKELSSMGQAMRPKQEWVVVDEAHALPLKGLAWLSDTTLHIKGEFGPTVGAEKNPFTYTDLVVIHAQVRMKAQGKVPLLVFDGWNDEVHHWRGSASCRSASTNEYRDIYLVVRGQEVCTASAWKHLHWKVYLHNPEGSEVQVEHFSIGVYRGNPRLLGLIQDF